MKKFSKIAVIILVLCLVFSVVALTGCGEQGEKGEKGDKGETGAVGPQGPKGDKGETGAVGPQGPKGDKGDDGVDGLSAWELYIAYCEENEIEPAYDNYADFLAAIINPAPEHECYYDADSIYTNIYNGWAKNTAVVQIYGVCSDLDCDALAVLAQDIVSTSTIDVAVGSYKYLDFSSVYASKAYAVLTLNVEEANEFTKFDVSLDCGSGIAANVSVDGNDPIEVMFDEEGKGIFALEGLIAGEHQIVVEYRANPRMQSTPDEYSFFGISAFDYANHYETVTATEVASGATQIQVGTSTAIVDGYAYYFTAATEGVYQITSNEEPALYTQEAWDNWGDPFVNFTFDGSYCVIMGENAVLNFVAAGNAGSSILIEKIADYDVPAPAADPIALTTETTTLESGVVYTYTATESGTLTVTLTYTRSGMNGAYVELCKDMDQYNQLLEGEYPDSWGYAQSSGDVISITIAEAGDITIVPLVDAAVPYTITVAFTPAA